MVIVELSLNDSNVLGSTLLKCNSRTTKSSLFWIRIFVLKGLGQKIVLDFSISNNLRFFEILMA